MCHTVLSSSSFWLLLQQVDEDLAAQTRAAGCRFCAGVLHRADYPRKPRGVRRQLLGEGYARRVSLCCAQDGCRRRHTPPSVRFLGRRVFLAAVVVLATALAQGLTGQRVAALREELGVSVRTLRRWQRWWREAFVATALWKSLRGQCLPVIAATSLPAGLLERCRGADAAGHLIGLLRWLAPLSCSSWTRAGC